MVSASCSTTSTVLPRSRSRAERVEQTFVVARVQPDRRLVEHVKHAAQLGADLRRQPYPLRLAAGERRGRAVQAQIVQPDGDRNSRRLRISSTTRPAICFSRSVRSHSFDDRKRLRDRQCRELGDRDVPSPEPPGSRLAGACRGSAGHRRATYTPSATRGSYRSSPRMIRAGSARMP